MHYASAGGTSYGPVSVSLCTILAWVGPTSYGPVSVSLHYASTGCTSESVHYASAGGTSYGPVSVSLCTMLAQGVLRMALCL